MTPCWNNREVRSLFFNYIFYVTVMMMMMMIFNAQCTKHGCTCPIFFVHSQTNPLLQQAPRIPPEKPSVPMVSEKFMSSKGPTCSLTPFKEIQSNSGGILICSGIFLGKPPFLEACLKISKLENIFALLLLVCVGSQRNKCLASTKFK